MSKYLWFSDFFSDTALELSWLKDSSTWFSSSTHIDSGKLFSVKSLMENLGHFAYQFTQETVCVYFMTTVYILHSVMQLVSWRPPENTSMSWEVTEKLLFIGHENPAIISFLLDSSLLCRFDWTVCVDPWPISAVMPFSPVNFQSHSVSFKPS